ncbi:MAG: Uma2 family endonuclease [Myxococcota bacterium]|jgi:Uma2 family endonuclease|nr:Uma2 family endonuclease [Myxococcota bacterium]
MSDLTPPVPHAPTRISVEDYFRLVETGVLDEDERVELLEGVIVSMPPSGPQHAAVVDLFAQALANAVGDRAAVRTEKPLLLGPASAPEPDVAVVPGSLRDYLETHPTRALLVVEVAEWSLAQDRLAKSRIYAAAGVQEYWIVNLRHGVVEVLRDPDPARALYRSVQRFGRGERIGLASLPGVEIDFADLVPAPDPTPFQ